MRSLIGVNPCQNIQRFADVRRTPRRDSGSSSQLRTRTEHSAQQRLPLLPQRSPVLTLFSLAESIAFAFSASSSAFSAPPRQAQGRDRRRTLGGRSSLRVK